MKASMKRAIDYMQTKLVSMSAPTLKGETSGFNTIRPVLATVPATATIGEILASKDNGNAYALTLSSVCRTFGSYRRCN